MKLWNMVGKYEGDAFVTTHLTHAGAVKSGISECLHFLGLEDGDSRFLTENQVDITVDLAEIQKMESDALVELFTWLIEETWDNYAVFSVDIVPATLEA